ncbi:MAG: hypothetical protein IJU62_00235 [Muribaculaceae bacterium]|nr:hypothetical protein [Muribaculaceae bacterium]
MTEKRNNLDDEEGNDSSRRTADAVNPTGAATGTDRVYRGGCWSDWHENNSRVTSRHFNRPDTMYLCLGLRLAL